LDGAPARLCRAAGLAESIRLSVRGSDKKTLRARFNEMKVDAGGIEPPTPGFSGHLLPTRRKHFLRRLPM
jgi:hypothetical protein